MTSTAQLSTMLRGIRQARRAKALAEARAVRPRLDVLKAMVADQEILTRRHISAMAQIEAGSVRLEDRPTLSLDIETTIAGRLHTATLDVYRGCTDDPDELHITCEFGDWVIDEVLPKDLTTDDLRVWLVNKVHDMVANYDEMSADED